MIPFTKWKSKISLIISSFFPSKPKNLLTDWLSGSKKKTKEEPKEEDEEEEEIVSKKIKLEK